MRGSVVGSWFVERRLAQVLTSLLTYGCPWSLRHSCILAFRCGGGDMMLCIPLSAVHLIGFYGNYCLLLQD